MECHVMEVRERGGRGRESEVEREGERERETVLIYLCLPFSCPSPQYHQTRSGRLYNSTVGMATA